MKIIFVRHGHPDYKLDCLTELGHLQAEAVAKKLESRNIQRVFASTRGRALETAAHIAARLGLEIERCDFMQEIGWGSIDEEPLYLNGHPWHVAADMVSNGQSIVVPDWDIREPFNRNKVVARVRQVEEGLDLWLSELGYERDGFYYRVREGNPDTIVMVSHGGSSSAAFAHLLNLPFPLFCVAIRPNFTAVTEVSFEGEEGSLISPQVKLLNDAQHIAGISVKNDYGM